jgi:hypothetical protein
VKNNLSFEELKKITTMIYIINDFRSEIHLHFNEIDAMNRFVIEFKFNFTVLV